MPPLDPDTATTLRQMVGYIRDDRRIARYLGIDEAKVRTARSYLATHERGRLSGQRSMSDENRYGGYASNERADARINAKRGSARLLEALAGAAR